MAFEEDGGDLLAVAQTNVLPGLARVGRLVHAVADGEVRLLEALAAADVEDARVGCRDGESADSGGRLIVEQRLRDAGVVAALPGGVVVDAEGEGVGLTWHVCGGVGPVAAKSLFGGTVHD